MIDATGIAERLRRLGRLLALDETEAPESAILGTADDGQLVTVPVPADRRAHHQLQFGATGCGKSELVKSVCLQEYMHSQEHDAPEKRLTLVVIDAAKGDFAEGIVSGLAAENPAFLPNVHWLHPFSPTAYALNFNRLALGKTPLDVRALQLAHLVAAVSTGVGAQAHLGAGARQIDAIEHLVLGALSSAHAQANVLWALDALEIPSGMKRLAAVATHPRAKAFLESARLSPELAASVKSRLRTALASTDLPERIVAAEDSIQFAPMTAPGQILVFTVHEPPGGLMELAEFAANLFGRLCFTHLLERSSPWNGHHLRIVIDEAQVIAGALHDLIQAVETRGRSLGLSLTVISQGTTLIKDASDTLLKVLLTNTPTKIVGRMNAADAELFAREHAPRRGSDETFSKFRQKLAAAITSLEDRYFFKFTPGGRIRFRSLDVDVDALIEAAEVHEDAIAAVKNRYALPSTFSRRVTLADATEPPKHRRKRAARATTTKTPTRSNRKGNGSSTKPAAPNEDSAAKPDKPRSKWG